MSSFRNERQYRSNLVSRSGLSDEQFYLQFYSQTDIPRELVTQMRSEFQRITGYDLSALHPTDNLALAFNDLDLADVLFCMERRFSVSISLDVCSDEIDGTFDSMLRFIHSQMCSTEAVRT